MTNPFVNTCVCVCILFGLQQPVRQAGPSLNWNPERFVDKSAQEMLLGSNNYQQTVDKRWTSDNNRASGPAMNNWSNNKTKEISIYQQLPPNPRKEPRWEQTPLSNNQLDDDEWVNDDDLPDDAKDPWGDDEAAAESFTYQNFENPGPPTNKQQQPAQQWKPQNFQNFSNKTQWPMQVQLNIPLNIPGNPNRWQPEATKRNNPVGNFQAQQWQQQSMPMSVPFQPQQQQQQQQPQSQSHHRGPSTRFF